VAGVALSNPEKLLYPEAGLAKQDLARYYEAVGERMLVHLAQRPLTLLRCPDGWAKGCFFQKHAETGVPEAVTRIDVGRGKSAYLAANSVPAIVALLQIGALELHPWGSRAPDLGHPDRLVFDLDPDESLPWADIRQAAEIVKTLLTTLGLTAFLKTTGGKGLHVVVPVEPVAGWDDAKGFSKAVAELLERTFPDRFTSKLLKVSRGGRVFIDYLRNAEGATAVAAYSLRARDHAPVSMPIAWSELVKDVRFAYFNASNVPNRLVRRKTDPWARWNECATPLTPAMMAKVGYQRQS
jgi:bifunctional non-homologous end joining protein LigD